MSYEHIPVLLSETVELLNLTKGENVFDGTVGGGGHAEKILEKTAPEGHYLGIDLDTDALEAAKETLSKFGSRVQLMQGNYKDIKHIHKKHQSFLPKIDAVLLDVGASAHQLGSPTRGFSFRHSAPLDMRFSQEDGTSQTAEHILNHFPIRKLEQILRDCGEEPYAARIAEAIGKARKERPIKTTTELAELVTSVYPKKVKAKLKIHPATKTFQALRIAVNDELSNLKIFLPNALEILNPGGRLAIISFHSLEDRIVKNFFRNESKDCLCPPEFPVCRCEHKSRLKIITKKPIKPTQKEINLNPKSRSAKLRTAEKI